MRTVVGPSNRVCRSYVCTSCWAWE